MRGSLRSGNPAGPLIAAALAACLNVPSLPHTHGPHPAPTASVTGEACRSVGSSEHLHPASTHPAPPCPACAAGSAQASVIAPADELAPSACDEELAAAVPESTHESSLPSPRPRAPPCLRAA